MGYLKQTFAILFNNYEDTKDEDYTSYESWYEVLEEYTYEELQVIVDEYNLYHIGNVKLMGRRIVIDLIAKFMSANRFSCKYYRKR